MKHEYLIAYNYATDKEYGGGTLMIERSSPLKLGDIKKLEDLIKEDQQDFKKVMVTHFTKFESE